MSKASTDLTVSDRFHDEQAQRKRGQVEEGRLAAQASSRMSLEANSEQGADVAKVQP